MNKDMMAKAYLRVCKDSGFKMDAIKAATFTAELIKCNPREIYAVGGFNNLSQIAKGTHPFCQTKV